MEKRDYKYVLMIYLNSKNMSKQNDVIISLNNLNLTDYMDPYIR